tara:strand:- start:3505 stop:3945 length:441 start_codon:yes stop_codon:yes gene_type:complete
MNIKKVIKRLVEAEVTKRYPMPPEIKDALENKLQMNPIPRFVNNLKAINSIPPSYRIFLHNNQYFDVSFEEFSLMVKIGVKEYYLADLDERNHAIKDINRLLTGPIMKKQGEEEEGSPPPEGGGAPPSLPSLPPLPDLPEPPEPEA